MNSEGSARMSYAYFTKSYEARRASCIWRRLIPWYGVEELPPF